MSLGFTAAVEFNEEIDEVYEEELQNRICKSPKNRQRLNETGSYQNTYRCNLAMPMLSYSPH